MSVVDTLPSFKTHRNYFFVILVIAIIFSIRECAHQKNTNELIENISTYSDSAKYYKGKHGEEIAYNKTLHVQNETQLKAFISTNEQIREEIKKFKSIKEVTIIKEHTEIHDTIKVPENAIPCDFKPFTLRKENKNYKFKGILSPTDFVIDSLYIPNEVAIIIGKRKIKFLKYEEQVTVNNSNPYIKTTNISNVSIQHEKKWWDYPLVKFGSGVLVGYGISAAQQGINSIKK